MSARDEMRNSGTHYAVGPDPDNDPTCWCGEDHPLETGETGAEKIAVTSASGYWTPISDPKAQAALDDLYLEAWLDD